ncbi:hypothetical protein TRIP_C20936 [Candidatus Zixiibacteriota bacterium]|nr:hypothetical protein TRIP_C20936 [candidate division Zixibacteria bacterium]
MTYILQELRRNQVECKDCVLLARIICRTKSLIGQIKKARLGAGHISYLQMI